MKADAAKLALLEGRTLLCVGAAAPARAALERARSLYSALAAEAPRLHRQSLEDVTALLNSPSSR